MTLVLGCVTQGYAIQVSDRRLTYPDGTSGDEARNKAVLLCNSSLFSYTGVWPFPPWPKGSPRIDTAEWIGRQIRDLEEGHFYVAAYRIRDRLNGLGSRNLKILKEVGHAILGVGYIPNPSVSGRVPMSAIVKISIPKDSREYKVTGRSLQRGEIALANSVGHPLLPSEKQTLLDRIFEVVSKRADPWTLAQVLCSTIVDVSLRAPPVNNVMNVLCIPRKTLFDTGHLFFPFSPPHEEYPTFFVTSNDEKIMDELATGVNVGPIMACGGAMYLDFGFKDLSRGV